MERIEDDRRDSISRERILNRGSMPIATRDWARDPLRNSPEYTADLDAVQR